VHGGGTGDGLRPSVAAAAEEAARQARVCIVFIFHAKKKKWLMIEVITLLEYVNNF
jgi:hypothetical protein